MKASCGAAVARFLTSGLAIAPGVQAIYYGAITAQVGADFIEVAVECSCHER